MYMSELLLDYIEHLEVEGGRSAKTAENYRLYLERFIEFTDNIAVGKITPEIVRKYRLWLNRYRNQNDVEAARIAAENPCLACGLTCDIRSIDPERASAYRLSNETPAEQATTAALAAFDAVVLDEFRRRGTVWATTETDAECGADPDKIGSDADGRAGGCDNIRIDVGSDGMLQSSYQRIAD